MNNFKYDENLFLTTMHQCDKELETINKNNLIAGMSIYYHAIEKGLSLPNVKPNFGVQSNVLNTLYLMTKIFIKRFGSNHKILEMIYDTLNEYFNFHTDRQIIIECKYLKDFLSSYKYLKNNDIKKGGIINLNKKNILNISDNFFLNRRSVRIFNNKPIDIDIINNIIKNSLYGTPTVCNRPINNIKVILNSDKINELLSYQAGNSGFGKIPLLLLITANLENYENSNERRSPYIGGGMFAQSIVYALHAKGIGSCCLNWDTNYNNDISVKKILNLNNETIIMYIAAGYYDDNVKVAMSEKPELKDIITYFI